jgi:hypothetical protein
MGNEIVEIKISKLIKYSMDMCWNGPRYYGSDKYITFRNYAQPNEAMQHAPKRLKLFDFG